MVYMPPEELTGDIDENEQMGNVYSYGVLLYELIVGQRYAVNIGWDCRHGVTLAQILASGKRPPIPAAVNPAIASVIQKCLEIDPSNRRGFTWILKAFQSARWSFFDDIRSSVIADFIAEGRAALAAVAVAPPDFVAPQQTEPLPVAVPALARVDADAIRQQVQATPLSDRVMSFDDYTVVRDLGSGGFGTVRLLRNNTTGKMIAVKVISASADFNTERFMRELQCQALVHPCLLALVGFSLPSIGLDSSAKIATEYMSGGSLDIALRDAKENRAPRFWTHTGIAKILVGIALGMQFLHSQHIVHRDLKPGNVLLDDNGLPHVGDFGSAKSTLDPGLATPNTGTPAYRAPEMLDLAEDHTEKVDSYAFGLILFEVLMGKPVFDPKTPAHVVAYRSSVEMRPPIPIGAMHPSLKIVIENCWAVLPRHRPTFDVILEDFERNNYPFYSDVNVADVRNYIRGIRESGHS
jgi:serine/threonine protein kinase